MGVATKALTSAYSALQAAPFQHEEEDYWRTHISKHIRNCELPKTTRCLAKTCATKFEVMEWKKFLRHTKKHLTQAQEKNETDVFEPGENNEFIMWAIENRIIKQENGWYELELH